MSSINFFSLGSYESTNRRKYIYSDCPEVLGNDIPIGSNGHTELENGNGIITLTYTLAPYETIEAFLYTNNTVYGNYVPRDISTGIVAFPYSGSGNILLMKYEIAYNRQYSNPPGENGAYTADWEEITSPDNCANATISLSPSRGTVIAGGTCPTGICLESRMKIKSQSSMPIKIAVYITHQQVGNSSSLVVGDTTSVITNPNPQNASELALYQLTMADNTNYATTTGIYTYPLITFNGQQHVGIEGLISPNQDYSLMSFGNHANFNEFSFLAETPAQGDNSFSKNLGKNYIDGNYGVLYHLIGVNTSRVTISPVDQLLHVKNDGSIEKLTGPTTLYGADTSNIYLMLPGGANGNISINTF